MLAFTSVRDDVPLGDVTRDLERLSHEAQAADQPAPRRRRAEGAGGDRAGRRRSGQVTTARGELSEALVDFVATSTEPMGLEPGQRPASRRRRCKPIAARCAELEHDDEMREVFLEEAREVVGDAPRACASSAARARRPALC